jgi:hypothetical protein
MDNLLTLFARKEPTRDELASIYMDAKTLATKKDVVFYKDKDCRNIVCAWPWHNNPPRKNAKQVTINCYNWRLKWLPDVKEGFNHE